MVKTEKTVYPSGKRLSYTNWMRYIKRQVEKINGIYKPKYKE